MMIPLVNWTVLRPDKPLPVKYLTFVMATGVVCARRLRIPLAGGAFISKASEGRLVCEQTRRKEQQW